MSDWECPHCGTEHDYGRNPDVLEGLSSGGQNKVSFECDCGCTFEMYVDFDPCFTVDSNSIKRPTPKSEGSAEQEAA